MSQNRTNPFMPREIRTLSQIESVRIGANDIQAIHGLDGEGYVVVRRMCEALGLDDDAQRVKLQKSPWATTLIIKAVAEDGRNRELFCLHVKSVPMWLDRKSVV